jgi:hypothetical protein
MKYLVCMKQEEEGCDYSIGCGMVYKFLDFDGKPEDAARYFAILLAYPDGEEEWQYEDDESDESGFALQGENALSEAWFVPEKYVSKLDFSEVLKAHEEKRKTIRAKNLRNEELKELARLKAKYEGKA